MTDAEPRTIYREDYRPPDYLIERIDLSLDLDEAETRVISRLAVRRNYDGSRPLILDGSDLRLISVRLDGETLDADAYQVNDASLTIANVPAAFALEIETEIKPQENTSLEGLYKSSGTFCTQCEAEGFRKITYYPDRPDVMARFSTTITADAARYPVLLSNGNLVSQEDLGGGRHRVRWEDPFPKPAYLFALVAGDLAAIEDSFVTRSGRDVALRIFVEPGNQDRCAHAMASLKRSMAWDEERFGREYDLDIFMIVAVGDFNMGAMENKGLNIFNTKYVLADTDTATDDDFENIESVIGHEYFHNWSGNRVTCRDWFQLSLKEGLTIFRDQEFSSDVGARAVKRINDVARLRATQFPEDAGPMAHPVRPDSYIEVNNFYTTTVYEKGGEVVRMVQTLIGEEAFRKGMDLYFERHDGQAVTCDDFIAAMEAASGRDLGQFRRWYAQAGTPQVDVTTHFDKTSGHYKIRLSQSCPPTPGQPDKEPLHIPIAVGLLGPKGEDLPLRLVGESSPPNTRTRILELTEPAQEFEFRGIDSKPVASVLRGFSAPVKMNFPRSDEELAFLMRHDPDPFNRWEAGQRYAVSVILRRLSPGSNDQPLDADFCAAFASILGESTLDPAYRAMALTLPSEAYLGECVDQIDVEGIHHARRFVRKALAESLRETFIELYQTCRRPAEAGTDATAIGYRRARNRALDFLASLDDPESTTRCIEHHDRAENMTDRIAALSHLVDGDAAEREDALADFYDRWKDNPLVIDKWFTLQAMSCREDTQQVVSRLLDHPDFSFRNPNRFRSLVSAFAMGNRIRFHDPSGAGYQFLTEQILTLDPLNPQVAARAVAILGRWRRFDPPRQALMKGELEIILNSPELSKDVYELASKSLA